MDLSTEIAGIRLEHPILNAAGTCRLLEEVRSLSRSASSAIMVGSITTEPRDGNTGDVYWASPMFSLNSLGMPNRGGLYYRQQLPTMVSIAHDANKPLFVSIAGFSPDEYAELAELSLEAHVDLIELNLGCPNIWVGSMQKRIASFNPLLVAAIVERTERAIGAEGVVSAKCSPYSDPEALQEMAHILRASSMVKVVTTMSTFPNAFGFADTGTKPSIVPGGGLAGFGGPAVKPIGLGQVRQFRQMLPQDMHIMGVGGISHGRDVKEYLQCGATAVQVATAYLERHEVIFSTLLSELLETE